MRVYSKEKQKGLLLVIDWGSQHQSISYYLDLVH